MPCGECKWWYKQRENELTCCHWAEQTFPKWFKQALLNAGVNVVVATLSQTNTDCPQFTPRAQEEK